MDCSKIDKLQVTKQMNLRAYLALEACGRVGGGGAAGSGAGAAAPSPSSAGAAAPSPSGAGAAAPSPSVSVGGNVNLITGAETLPHVTQSESFVWSQGNTVVVNYNDSRTAPANYSGVSVSTDGGAHFTRLDPSPFATGHGTNFGDPIVAYDAKLGTWFAGDLATGCGGQGIGLWTSTAPATSWTTGACVHSGSVDDRESMWVDNNSASPHYGRLYVSWNDFAADGALVVSYSDDGATWSAPVTLNGSFIRDVQLTGSRGTDGTVFVAAMDEGGGGLNPRQNVMYKSIDGGVTWTRIVVGTPFPAAGASLCSDDPYFAKIDPIWRQMGWGQPAAGTGGVVAYDYAAHGAGSDTSDIYFTRSTDNGTTWGVPVKLNTDSTVTAQWMPSLLFTDNGHVFATWYDRSNSTNLTNYQRIGRESTDNGATWGPEIVISNVLIPQPTQPDPAVQPCYAGDYNYITATGNKGYDAWTDGRVSISGTPQQDVFAVSLKF